MVLLTAGGAQAAPQPLPRPNPNIVLAAGTASIAPQTAAGLLARVANIAASTETPAIVKSTGHFYCVEFARLRSGLAVFGDAKRWWARARDRYAEMTTPSVKAVMVFKSSKRMRSGHVAVVSQVISPREVRVEQANWQNRGEVSVNVPVVDVSAKNDWSKVRVWDMRSNTLGIHVYPVNGFIAPHTAEKPNARQS